LDTGVVVKIFVDNPFPVELYKATSSTAEAIPSVIGIDVSLYRTLVAIVNSQNVLTVIDLRSQAVLLSKNGVLSVCFNSEVDDMLCYTSSLDSSVFVISGIGGRSAAQKQERAGAGTSASSDPQEQLQYVAGQAVGFQGQKIYCLNRGVISGADVPQSVNMMRALDAGDMRGAYSIACLGATEADWKLLAIRSLRANCLDVAKNAFARLKDTKILSLLEVIERGDASAAGGASFPSGDAAGAGGLRTAAGAGPAAGDRRSTRTRGAEAVPVAAIGGAAAFKGEKPLDPMWQAELLAYEGHHQEAAKTFARAGKVDEAIRLLTDLRRWDDAKVFAQNAGRSDLSNLTTQQAKWLHEIKDWKGASELYVSMGQHMQAAQIVAEAEEAGWPPVLMEVVRSCPPDVKDVLLFCGEAFNKADEDAFARETFLKAGDISQLMSLYAKRQMWAEAAKLADEHEGKFDVSVFLPYAEWLVSQDRYEEAMTAFKKAGRRDLAKKVLEELTFNAVSESRFKDAAYYYWLLSREGEGVDNFPIQLQSEFEQKADLYFAYANVHTYITDPFTSSQPEMLFQVSRYIINSLGNSDFVPFGISKAATLFTLARQAMALGAFKLAKNAYERLGKMQSLPRKQEDIEMDMLVVQAKPMRDEPDILPVCYRCSSTNPLLNPFTNKFAKGDVCTNCGHPFVRSFINFDILPLVEFVPDQRISDEDAIDMIRLSPGDKRRSGGWKEGKEGDADTMTLDADDDADGGGGGRGRYAGGGFEGFGKDHGDGDMFTKCVNSTLEKQKNAYIPTTVDAETLSSMNRSEVYVCRPSSKNKRATFYRNMLPEISIAISQPCHRFFHLEDFEFAYLSNKNCPYSRLKSVGEYGSL
jgi:intraflagellar transport protein 122